MAILNHDVPFGVGFIPTMVDYQYMAQLRKEKVKARLTHTPFDYFVCPYTMSLTDYFVSASESQMPSDGIIGGLSIVQEVELQRLVHQLQLSDEASGTLTSALVVPSSLDHMSLMMLYFPNEIDEQGTFAEIKDLVDGVVPHDEYIDEMLVMSISQIEETVQSKLASPFDLFGVFVIKIVKEIQIAPTPEFIKDVTVVNDLFDGHVGPVEGAFDFVDPPLSFDVLSGFVSRSDNVHDSSFMDLSIFEYLSISCDITLFAPSSPTSQIFDIDDEIVHHNSDADSSSAFDLSPSDQRVSPTTGDAEIVDFGTTDQPRDRKSVV